MIFMVSRTWIAIFLAVLLALPLSAVAQDKQDTSQTKTDTKSKKKNGDVDNIGNRNINKGSINFISLEKEIAMGRQMAAEIERRHRGLAAFEPVAGPRSARA